LVVVACAVAAALAALHEPTRRFYDYGPTREPCRIHKPDGVALTAVTSRSKLLRRYEIPPHPALAALQDVPDAHRAAIVELLGPLESSCRMPAIFGPVDRLY
jgi:hypothetical protein